MGSVGLRAFVVLLQSRAGDPLILQFKEATESVLAAHLDPSPYAHQGQRVVEGQRLMQAASDIFLGWSTSSLDGRHYYWRQLRDMKGSADIETTSPKSLRYYAGMCGWSLARAHARSGSPAAIAAYLGRRDRYDRAATTFAELYADLNAADYARHDQDIADGTLPRRGIPVRPTSAAAPGLHPQPATWKRRQARPPPYWTGPWLNSSTIVPPGRKTKPTPRSEARLRSAGPECDTSAAASSAESGCC